MKRILDFAKTQIIFILLTATIICSGLFVPRIILNYESNKEIIAKGRVDAGMIQPYGASVILAEQYIATCLDFTSNHIYYGVQDRDSELSNQYYFTDQCTVIPQGRISWDRDLDSNYTYPVPRDGFVLTDSIMDITQENFYMTFIGDRSLVYLEDTTDPSLSAYVIRNYSELIVMEPHTGIPTQISMKFLSTGYEDLNNYCMQIVSAYSEMTGIQFIEEVTEECDSSVDGYDITWERVYRSSDQKFRIGFKIQSGWYWSYSNNDWDPTEDFVWTINIYLAEE